MTEVSSTITQLEVKSSISQLDVGGTIIQSGYTSVPPIFVSAVVWDANPDIVLITFSEALDETFADYSAFSFSGITGDPSPSAVSVSGTVVSITLDSNVVEGDTVLVSYTQPGSNPLQDLVGDDVLSFTDESVINNVGR